MRVGEELLGLLRQQCRLATIGGETPDGIARPVILRHPAEFLAGGFGSLLEGTLLILDRRFLTIPALCVDDCPGLHMGEVGYDPLLGEGATGRVEGIVGIQIDMAGQTADREEELFTVLRIAVHSIG